MFGKYDPWVRPFVRPIIGVSLVIVALFFINLYLGRKEPIEKAKVVTVSSEDSLAQSALAFEQGKKIKPEKGEKEKKADKEKKDKVAEDSLMFKLNAKLGNFVAWAWAVVFFLMILGFGTHIIERIYVEVPEDKEENEPVNQPEEKQSLRQKLAGHFKVFIALFRGKKPKLPPFGDLCGGEVLAIAVFFVLYFVGWYLGRKIGGFEQLRYPAFASLVMFCITIYAEIWYFHSSLLQVPENSRWLLEQFGKFKVILFTGPHFFLRISYYTDSVTVTPSEDEDGRGKMDIDKKKTLVKIWHVPDLNCVTLREITYDMEKDDVLTVDGLRPTVDVVLAYFVPDINPLHPIKGLGARKQAVWKYVYQFVRNPDRDDLIQGLQSETDTAIRQYAAEVPYVRQVGEITFNFLVPEGKKPLNEAQADLEKVIRQRIVQGEGVAAAICEKGGLSIRSVQVKKIEPPKDFEAKLRSLQESQIAAVTAVKKAEGDKTVAIKKAEGEREKRIIEADGDKKAELARAEGLGEGIAILAEKSGLDARAAADYRLTREAQKAFVAAAEGSNSTVLSVPDSVGGLETLIAAGRTVFPTGGSPGKDAGSDKGEKGKPGSKGKAGSKRPEKGAASEAPASGVEEKEGGEEKKK